MGDRVDCTLLLRAAPSETTQRLLRDALGEPQDTHGPMQMTWHMINYGSMGETLEDDLVAAQVAFAWLHEAGGGYGAMVTVNDPAVSDEGAVTYATSNQEIVLTVAMAEDPAEVAQARRWADWLDETWTLTSTAAQLTGADT